LRESQKIVGAKGDVERDGDDTYVTFTGKKHTSVQSTLPPLPTPARPV
jgi:hypothetical protein